MLLTMLLATATPADHIAACKAAVETALPTAAIACDERSIKIDLFDSSKPSYSDACLIALKSGRQLGEHGAALPAPVLQGRKRDFQDKMAKCQIPTPKQDVPMRDSVNLWE